MTVTITDKDIEKAVIAYAKEYYDRLDAVPDTHVFSERYEKRKAQVIAYGAKPLHRVGAKRVMHNVAAMIAILILSLSLIMAFSPTARAAVLNWFKETYDKIVHYKFTHQEDDHSYVICDPGSLPEGFVRTDLVMSGNYTLKVYKNVETVEYLRFEYCKATDNMLAEIEKQSAGAELLETASTYKKYCLKSGAACRVFWYDPNRQLVFFADSNMNMEDLIHSIETISLRLPLYEPTWLPEGYEEVERNMEYPSVDFVYMSKDCGLIVYTYSDMAETDLVAADLLGQGLMLEPVLINGITADYYAYKDQDGGDLIWIDDKVDLVFMISSSLSKDEIVKTAESILCVEHNW